MRINRIEKSIYSRIDKLEAEYPPMNFDIQEHIIEIITPIENYFGYKIRDRIILEVKGINRVLWDYSNKPVSTIEYE